MLSAPLFHIRCVLQGLQPAVWRSLYVPPVLTFHQLRILLAVIFDWHEEEDYYIDFGTIMMSQHPKKAGDQGVSRENSKVWQLDQVLIPGLRFNLHIHSGWDIQILVAGLAEMEPLKKYPTVIAGEHAIPQESIGGPSAYAMMYRNPKQKELWKPEKFNISDINQKIEDAMTKFKKARRIKQEKDLQNELSMMEAFMSENDVQFDLHTYQHELETTFWQEKCPSTLEEAIRNLNNEDLIGLFMVYGIEFDQHMDDESLVTRMLENLPKAIRSQAPYLDDRQGNLLRLVAEEPNRKISFSKADLLFTPYELYYFHDRLLLFPMLEEEESFLYMLEPVQEALKIDMMQNLARTQLQNSNRRRMIAGMFQYYGVLGMEEIQALVSDFLDEKIDLDTVIVDVQELQDFSDAVTIGERLVMHTALDSMKAEEIWIHQQLFVGMPYKKISLEILDLAGDWMFVDVIREAEILVAFITQRYGYSTTTAEGFIWELMHRFRWGESLEMSLELVKQTLIHPDSNAEKRIVELITDLWLNSPSWNYKGWSPIEVRDMALEKDEGMSWVAVKTNNAGAPEVILPEITDHIDSIKRQKKGKVLTFPAAPRKPKLH